MNVLQLIDILWEFNPNDEVVIGPEFRTLPIKEVSQYESGTVNIEVDTEVKDEDLYFSNDDLKANIARAEGELEKVEPNAKFSIEDLFGRAS